MTSNGSSDKRLLTSEQLQEAWTLLEVSPQLEKRSYLQKKASLTEHIAEIDEKIAEHRWRWWPTWQLWNFERFPIWCHDCGYPTKCHPVFRGNKMVKIECSICNLVMWNREVVT
jgi:hypothetical protein